MTSELRKNSALIGALAEETDRQRGLYAQRSGGLLTRASVLTAAASILTGLNVAGGVAGFYAVSIVAAALAAISGGLVLLPRRGGEVDVEEAERRYWNESAEEATRNLTAYKLSVLRTDEHSLFWRARMLFFGFGMLALSIVLAAVSLILQVHGH